MAKTSPLGNLIGSLVPSSVERQADTELAAPVARRLPSPRPDGEVVVRLRNGRRVRARITPGVARRADLAGVARAAASNDRRAAAALRRHRAAIAELRQSREELTKKVEALERRASLPFGDLLPDAAALQQRVRDLQAVSVKTPAQAVGSVVNSLQAAAYGDKGSLLTTNNLLIAGNQLFWTLLDPVLRATGLVNAGTANVLAIAAPFATLFTGEILVGNRQQTRFLSGVTTFDAPGTARELLAVADHLRGSLRARTDVPVTVSALDPVAPPFVLSGRVVNGVLEIQLIDLTPAAAPPPEPVPAPPPPAPPPIEPIALAFVVAPPPRPPFTPVRVAWTVDLGEAVG